MKTKSQEEFGQKFQDSQELLRLQDLAEKKMWLSGILGSIFGCFDYLLRSKRSLLKRYIFEFWLINAEVITESEVTPYFEINFNWFL
ncbi:hypothetical protein Sta7437_4606 (plasmid) [Stanieria cyanosphaera PCC 7437]|uniref:Uncharacterized protein n=1 Tax=Stanieria cyanosphaera (strain ATCC 29371 / PCC 7437) TaxID=111780 RepID=K9Y178_STAC7|nr:hypothetical protein Sta7437_4606 [Stanieria cyanosphaera PCC 7437]